MQVKIIGQMDNTMDHTYESANRVYDSYGIAPTVNTCGGGWPATENYRDCNTTQRTSDDACCKIKRLGNVYGEQFGNSYGGNVWDLFGISPTLKTGASASQQCVIEIKRIDNNGYRKIKPKE